MSYFAYRLFKKRFTAAVTNGRIGAGFTKRFHFIGVLLLFTALQGFAQITVNPATKTRSYPEDTPISLANTATGSSNNLLSGVSSTGGAVSISSYVVNGTIVPAGTAFTITGLGTIAINAHQNKVRAGNNNNL